MHVVVDRFNRDAMKFALHLQALFLRASELKQPAGIPLKASNIQERDVEKYPTL